MLRTFDDLGFRQEQRFHLELGLLKLVHLQRLLPMEQFLSQLPRPTSTPATKTSLRPERSTAEKLAVPREAPIAQGATLLSSPTNEPLVRPEDVQLHRTSAVVKPAVFESSTDLGVPHVAPLRHESELAEDPVPITSSSVRPERSVAEAPAVPREVLPTQSAIPSPDPEATEPASASEPHPATVAIQAAAVEALFAAGNHNSAAEQLETTTWTVENGSLNIQTALSKQLMATIFRPEVEAIIKGALRNMGVTGLRLTLLPGTPDAKPSAPRKPRTGTAQAKALDHPTVQAAQKLFNAEVTNVFDLRRD